MSLASYDLPLFTAVRHVQHHFQVYHHFLLVIGSLGVCVLSETVMIYVKFGRLDFYYLVLFILTKF